VIPANLPAGLLRFRPPGASGNDPFRKRCPSSASEAPPEKPPSTSLGGLALIGSHLIESGPRPQVVQKPHYSWSAAASRSWSASSSPTYVRR